MPFNGTGTFVRLENWTNDANANLPISATKFDIEDNDFAGGLSLCLTRDGQGAPSSPLNWTVPLALSIASDIIGFQVGRTGGSNNPQFQVTAIDASGVTLNATNGGMLLELGGTPMLSLLSTKEVKIAAQSGLSAVDLTTAIYAFGNATDNPVYNFLGTGGATFGNSLLVSAAAAVPASVTIAGNGLSAVNGFILSCNTTPLAQFQFNGAIRGTINASGAWNFNPAAAGNTMTVQGQNNTFALLLNGAATSGQSYGLTVQAGTTAADWAAIFRDKSGANILEVRGDDAVLITDNAASPTLFQVGYMDAPQNVQNAAYGFLLADRGKQVYHSSASAHTYTIPANASIAFPIGSVIQIINSGAGNVTIAITTDTLAWYPTGTGGSRTLSQFGSCTIEKITATAWIVQGVGLS